jgi:glycosyltransferase involved in cell wall biosynthesis
MIQKVLMRWQANSLFGWGILGLNLFQHWAADADIQPLMGARFTPRDLQGIDPLRYAALSPAAAVSNEFFDALSAGGVDLGEREVIVIDAFGNSFAEAAPRGREMGLRNVARCIFENTRLDDTTPVNPYDNLLCASEWNAGLLRSVSTTPVTMIHEGIDHSLFFPGPRSGLLDPECFYVFTGGKIEFRKAQDLVLLAFREFAARHDDAVLVAAWNSPWPQFSAGFQGRLSAALQQGANGALEIERWVSENGIRPYQFIGLPLMPNYAMPAVLREMDCALQVSRCEACTNLPAKEAMACGIPVIVASNSGTRDLIDGDNCIALTAQGPVGGESGLGTDGWGESDVGEMVAALERLYTDTAARKRIGQRGAAWIVEHRRTWRDHAASLKAHLKTLA